MGQTNMESESEPSILEVQKLNFNLDSRTKDVHEGKKPFKCNVCDKKFIGNCDLVSGTPTIH